MSSFTPSGSPAYPLPAAYNFVAGGGVLGTQKHIIGQPNSPYFHEPDQPSDNTIYYNGFPKDYPRNNFALHLGGPLFTKQDEYIETPAGILQNSALPLPFSQHYSASYGRFRYGNVIYEWPEYSFDQKYQGPAINHLDIYDNDRFDPLYVKSKEPGWPFEKPWVDYTGTTLGELFHYFEAINNLSYYPPGMPGAVPTAPLAEAWQPQLPLGNNGTVFPPNVYPPAFNTEPFKSPFLNPLAPAPLTPQFSGADFMSVSPRSPYTTGYAGASAAPGQITGLPATGAGGLNDLSAATLNAIMSMGASALNETDPLAAFQSLNAGTGANPQAQNVQNPFASLSGSPLSGLPNGSVRMSLNDVFAPQNSMTPTRGMSFGDVTPLTGGQTGVTPGFNNNPISGAGNPFLSSIPGLPGNYLQNILTQSLGSALGGIGQQGYLGGLGGSGGGVLGGIGQPGGIGGGLGGSPLISPALPNYYSAPPLFSPNSHVPAPSLWGGSLSPGLYPYTPGVTPNYNQFTPPVPGLPGNFFNNPYSGYFPPTVVPANVPTIPTFYPYIPLDASPDWRNYVHRHVYGNEVRNSTPPREIFLGTNGVV